MIKNLLLSALFLGIVHAQTISREAVVTGLSDPMQMAVSPGGDLYVVEREGRILRVRPDTGGVFTIGQLKVEALRASDPDSHFAREDGLQGIALDPKFSTNHRIYLFYSAPDKSVDRLSRFEIKDGKFDSTSERIILDIPTERDKRVCHHGGSIQFGSDGLLYLSTGDNANPFDSDGFAPIDNREGRMEADAMRSAGNTNDLRGKILRIRPTETGYEIPPGNLFPVGTAKTRPEIYVMGCRNPFRISLNPKTGTLYWGEVGPDAANDGPEGPRGHDEINQAKGPGNFGWPFVIANQKPYALRDFRSGKVVEMIRPEAPINPGIRNTGIKNLPPAQAAFIWYPYTESAEFPAIGSGGRNAMAGPVFHYDPARKHNFLSKEDDGALLAYDWVRGKIWKVLVDQAEKFKALETVTEGLIHPMDMKMAADGTLWVLEYGSDWWFNRDGKILRLLPGSSAPATPLAISPNGGRTFSAGPVDASMTIDWWLTDGADERRIGSGPTVELLDFSGSELRAVATNGNGVKTIARHSLEEAAPEPSFSLELVSAPAALGFSESVRYKITGSALPDPGKTLVRARYIPPTGHDSGGAQFSAEVQQLVTSRQCFACHQVDHASVGPGYLSVALKYRDRPDAAEYLCNKLKTGGTGVWGEIPMPPQIALSNTEANTIVRSILGLAEGISESAGSLEGTLVLAPAPEAAAPGGAWEISAQAPGFSTFKVRLPAK